MCIHVNFGCEIFTGVDYINIINVFFLAIFLNQHVLDGSNVGLLSYWNVSSKYDPGFK